MANHHDGVNAKRHSDTLSTQHVAGDYAASAGFGSTATVTPDSENCNDTGGEVAVASSGTGQAANPTLTLTFKDLAFAVKPKAVVCRGTDTNQPTVPVSVVTTTTTMVIKFHGTPVAGETYRFRFLVVG